MLESLINNRSYRERKKKEFTMLFFTSIFLTTTIIMYTYFIYSPALIDDIPIILISYNEKPDFDDYVMCTFELKSDNIKESTGPIKSELKFQGNPASWRDKKSYRLQLTRRISLLGMRKDDDWVLMSMFSDYTRMREKLSIDLWRSLENMNPTAILPKSRYVSLYINGEFHGLYLLAEKIDRRLFDLDDAQNNYYSSLIFQAKYYTNFQEYIDGRWEQDWPNEDEGIFIMDEMMTNLIDFVNKSCDDEFFDPETGVYSKFEKLNLIDLYLFNFFILHQDCWYKNYYLIRNTYPNKFFFIPWDFDDSFGQSGWKLYNTDSNPDFQIKYHHLLFNRLLNNKEFQDECRKRWFYLRENKWTNEFILDMLTKIYVNIRNILKYEMKVWEPETVDEEPENEFLYSTKKFDLNEYINHLFDFLQQRLEFCDLYFGNFSSLSEN